MSTVITTDRTNRLAFRAQLLTKIEEALTPPAPEVEPEPEPIEIVERYATALPFLLEPMEQLLPEFKKDAPYVPENETFKRAEIKATLLDKVEDSLVPPTMAPEAPVIEIVEKYAAGIPPQLLDPVETMLPEAPRPGTFILDSDVPKRAATKNRLLHQVEDALIPPTMEPEPASVEIVEKYAFGIPRQAIDLAETMLPEGPRPGTFILDSDVPKRAATKNRLLHKVEDSLVPPALEPEPGPIEIVEEYSRGVAKPFNGPEEYLFPEVKQLAPHIPQREISKRAEIKLALLNKISESLTPPGPEPEPAPIEIIERYAHGLPQQLVGLSDKLPAEAKTVTPHIPDREVSKRAEIRATFLNRIEEALVPPTFEPEPEPAPIEIIERFAHGLPQQLTDPVEQMLPEAPQPGSFILDSDTPKRTAAKDRMQNKVRSARVDDTQVQPIEIVGYSQRSVSPFEPEFGEIDRPPVVISDEEPHTPPIFESVVEALVPVLRLPENYEGFDEGTLYGILIRTPALQHTSETANLTLDILFGRSAQPAEFEIVTAVPAAAPPSPVTAEPKQAEIADQFKVQDAEKRVAFASGLAGKVEDLLEPDPLEAEPSIKYELMLHLPDDWDTVPLAVLRADLLAFGGTPEQVDELLASLTQPEEEEISTALPVVEEVHVPVPEGFSTWKRSDQYVFLTRVQKLTPERANEVMYQ